MSLQIIKINDSFSVSGQISVDDIEDIADKGIRVIICNRPDGEANDQPNVAEIEAAAQKHNIQVIYQPVIPGQLSEDDIDQFLQHVEQSNHRMHAFCRTGTRSITLWARYQLRLGMPVGDVLSTARDAGYDLREALQDASPSLAASVPHYDIVIVGAGAAGIAVASSLMTRTKRLKIAIIDNADVH